MASVLLSATACSVYGTRHNSGRHLTRHVPSFFCKTVYLNSRNRPVSTAVHEHVATSVPTTSMTLSATDLHTQQAWEFWRKIGSPKYHVAPMVDQVSIRCCFDHSCSTMGSLRQLLHLSLLQSELAFRQLCLRYGATAAYTPMLHSRLFLEDPKYRAEHFTTCSGDR